MELEQLTKSQTVLLTLLVSFVTSIATGIVTVSLLDQAPPSITQTVNRVVERTVETVVPSVTQTASVVTKETTVVVKEEDLITDSITKTVPNIVTLYQGTTTNTALGFGVLVGNTGNVVTDLGVVREGGVYLVELASGVVYEALVDASSSAYAMAFLVPDENAKVPSVTGSTLGASKNTKIGQTVLSIEKGVRGGAAREGILSLYEEKDAGQGGTALFLKTSLSGKEPLPGTPLINIFGEVIGLATSASGVSGMSYASADAIAEFLLAKATAVPSND